MPASPHPDERFYPPALSRAEEASLAERRRGSGIEAQAPRVGLALSGGGIRSATFCLGLCQALARQRLIRRVDFLSTVSGGGYLGSFLGAAFSRASGNPDRVEADLSRNDSWMVNWLRENGRFLSPNGAGDNWQAAAVALRNWVSLQVVLLTFFFLLLGLGALIRADLCSASFTAGRWLAVEAFFRDHSAAGVWWSPWLLLPVVPFVAALLPAGSVYWLTQVSPLMAGLRRLGALFGFRCAAMSDAEFTSRAQVALTRVFTLGLILTVTLLSFALVDSAGQTVYLHWSGRDFQFPALWTTMTGGGAVAFGFAKKLAVYLERVLGSRKFRAPSGVLALLFAFGWLLLILLALSVAACGFAWRWQQLSAGEPLPPMGGGWQLMLAVAAALVASWIFSRSFGFVNLSSMQQMYAARLARAYLGATNPERQRNANHDMTDLLPGDDLAFDEYAPHRHGGPLHLINVTVNETLSGRTQIEKRDRKGLPLAVGPCGLSVGTDAHALWKSAPQRPSKLARLRALWQAGWQPIEPASHRSSDARPIWIRDPAGPRSHRVEALTLGRWVAISGAAFTTGTGANTTLGLSLLLGLANVRLGYWWDSGSPPAPRRAGARPNLMEMASRLLGFVLPVQTCLMNEFFARFHGPARRHWYLSDGGHFENTACYELIRRRVPFIICSDCGQDPSYLFADFANLVRKARTDFGAEIQVVRRTADLDTDDPVVRFPMPRLEELVHSSLLDVIGVPEDFGPLTDDADETGPAGVPRAKSHGFLARIHYFDTDEFAWLLVVKPSLMGDESADVVQYQRTHPLFPQEPTTDQYFDEAQWESYRKLGEHIGAALFMLPHAAPHGGGRWSPAQMRPPAAPDPSPVLPRLPLLGAENDYFRGRRRRK